MYKCMELQLLEFANLLVSLLCWLFTVSTFPELDTQLNTEQVLFSIFLYHILEGIFSCLLHVKFCMVKNCL